MAERAKQVKKTKTLVVDEEKQRRKYGGFNIGAAFYGWLVAIGIGVILTSLLIAAGGGVTIAVLHTTTKEAVNHATTVGLISGILILITGALSYFAGGYVAGRMSRFDGARQGFGVWIMGILLVIILAILGVVFGSKYNLLQQLNLPHIPTKEGTLTTGGLVTLILSLIVTILAAISGGKFGEHYHRKIDRTGEIRP